MGFSFQVTDISHVIQLAVAPVFLLAGISGMLSVLSIRLGRIIDRARRLDDKLAASEKQDRAAIHREHMILRRRARLASWAITLCTICALLICTVIVVLFMGAYLSFNPVHFIAWLFIISMISLISALLVFLREIYLGTSGLRIGGSES
jgi:hypothetical protein